MSSLSPSEELRSAIVAAIKAFDFDDYGMDEVDPNDEYAEWVPALAEQIAAAYADLGQTQKD
jgi:predicted extracellular nuclease